MQVLAIFNDSLRNLRSKSLFWVCLAISAVAAVLVFATYSFNDEGMRILWFHTIASPVVKRGSPGALAVVSFMFSGIYAQFWLTWGATILALVSTASVLPDFLAGGAIDLSLSRPITRLKLFAAKFFSALIFVFVQTMLGATIAYILIGLKVGMWMPAVWIAVPAVMLQFIFLYSVTALVAVVTRSTLASLIGTLVFWFVIFTVQLLADKVGANVATFRTMADLADKRIAALEQAAAQNPDAVPEALRARLDRARRDADARRHSSEQFDRWSRGLNTARLFVPKTADMQKVIANSTKAPTTIEFFTMLSGAEFRPPRMDEDQWSDTREAGRVAEKAVRDINIPVSLGTSLAFTFVVLGAATVIFTRRDF